MPTKLDSIKNAIDEMYKADIPKALAYMLERAADAALYDEQVMAALDKLPQDLREALIVRWEGEFQDDEEEE